MIRTLQQGYYVLLETKHHAKILALDDHLYQWKALKNVNVLVLAKHRPFSTDHVLATGDYNLSEVKNELALTGLIHLELSANSSHQQGYILPDGLPVTHRQHCRVVPTHELLVLGHGNVAKLRHAAWTSMSKRGIFKDLFKHNNTS